MDDLDNQPTGAGYEMIGGPSEALEDDALRALEAGRGVLLSPTPSLRLAAGLAIRAAAARHGRPVVVGHEQRFRRAERTLGRLVREGRLGTITHVSLLDRRTPRSSGADWLDQLDALRYVLDADPVQVLARLAEATTEVFLEMDRDINVQASFSRASNRDEHLLWIEGDRGVLRHDGRRLWWRKRGSRFFLPVRRDKVRSSACGQMTAALAGAASVECDIDSSLATLAMRDGAALSHETGRPQVVAELLAQAGGSAAAAPASSP